MKDLARCFYRHYSSVSVNDEQQQLEAGRRQRHKSPKTSHSMGPASILSFFFNERDSNKGARSPKRAFILLACGALALTMAVLVKVFHPYDIIFNWKLVLRDNGEVFNLWVNPPIDLYLKVYLFNITNADAFLAGRERLRVEQVGPYVYKEVMKHQNVTFNANNTISSTPSHPLLWQEHLSEGNHEDDEVIMVNIAMLAVSHLTADRSYFIRMALNTLFATSKTPSITRMTAKEFMFGYHTSLTTLANTFLPSWISFEKVGLIDRMYDFDSDYETFYTGVPDPRISGLYDTYRGAMNLPHWNGEYCSNIRLASDGTKFKSFLHENDTIKFFRKSMCRSINLKRVGDAATYGSLRGYKYVFEDNALDNGEFVRENSCYCRKGYCQPRGLIDVTDCYYGFPISLSYPHFLDGHPDLIGNVTGLAPSPQEHGSQFVVQPESGLPLSLSAKVQINMHFKDLRTFSKVARFSYLTVPMLWFEIMMPELPKALDTRFHYYINVLPYLDPIAFWGLLLLGAVMLVYAVTRATMRLTALGQPGTMSEGGLYAKANFFRAAATGGAPYRPRPMTLMSTNEQSPRKHLIGKCTENDDEEDSEMLYNEVNLKRRRSSYALEMEPAISDSGDEDHDSDTPSLGHHSTSSNCFHGPDGDDNGWCPNTEATNDHERRSEFHDRNMATSVSAAPREDSNTSCEDTRAQRSRIQDV